MLRTTLSIIMVFTLTTYTPKTRAAAPASPSASMSFSVTLSSTPSVSRSSTPSPSKSRFPLLCTSPGPSPSASALPASSISSSPSASETPTPLASGTQMPSARQIPRPHHDAGGMCWRREAKTAICDPDGVLSNVDRHSIQAKVDHPPRTDACASMQAPEVVVLLLAVDERQTYMWPKLNISKEILERMLKEDLGNARNEGIFVVRQYIGAPLRDVGILFKFAWLLVFLMCTTLVTSLVYIHGVVQNLSKNSEECAEEIKEIVTSLAISEVIASETTEAHSTKVSRDVGRKYPEYSEYFDLHFFFDR